MNITDFDNLHDAVAALYPNHRNLFEYDTAKPQTLMDKISATISEKYPSNDKHVIYGELRCSVYAYGRGSRSEGFLPLTQQCAMYLRWYNEITGHNLVFTPIIEDLRPTQVEV